MTVLTSTNPTLYDWINTHNPKGEIAQIAEVLNQTNETDDFATVLQANDTTSHQTTVRTGFPTVYWRSLNQGVLPSKSTKATVRESIALVESRAEVDQVLADLGGDPNGFRWSESVAHLESMAQELQSTLLYGNPAGEPNVFMGLAPRYSSTTAGNGENVLLGGSATESVNTSVWLIGWAPGKVYKVFPRGMEKYAGIYHEDLSVYDAQDVNGVAGTRMRVYGSLFRSMTGLVVEDWRYAVRIANLQVSALTALSGVHAPTVFTNLLHLMEQAIVRMPQLGGARFTFVANRTVCSALRRLALEKSTSALSIEASANQFGTPRQRLSYQGIPVALCDQLLNTEALVS